MSSAISVGTGDGTTRRTKRRLTSGRKRQLPLPEGPKKNLPPVPGSRGEGEPVITDAQLKRVARSGGMEHTSTIARVFGYMALAATVLVILVPLYFIVVTSFKTFQDVYSDQLLSGQILLLQRTIPM